MRTDRGHQRRRLAHRGDADPGRSPAASACCPGASMAERRLWFMENSDDLRTLLMYEPRGHASMSGAILQPPTRPDADYGVLFIEVSGLLPMCGHGTMGVATVLVETGMVPVIEPVTTIRLEVPAGLVVAEVAVERRPRHLGDAADGAQSSPWRSTSRSQVPGFGSVGYDIAYGGNFYAIVELASLGLPFDRAAKSRLLDAGLAIMAAINEQNRARRTRSAPTSPAATTSTSRRPARRRSTPATRWRSTPAGSTGPPAAPAPAPGWPSCTPAASCALGHRLRQRVLHRLALPRPAARETDRRRPAGGACPGHRPRLGDRHRAVHARPRRPVPRRLPAVSPAPRTHADVVVDRRGRGGRGVRVLRRLGPGCACTWSSAGPIAERHQQRLRGQPARLGQGGRSRARPRALLPPVWTRRPGRARADCGSSRPRAAWSSRPARRARAGAERPGRRASAPPGSRSRDVPAATSCRATSRTSARTLAGGRLLPAGRPGAADAAGRAPAAAGPRARGASCSTRRAVTGFLRDGDRVTGVQTSDRSESRPAPS